MTTNEERRRLQGVTGESENALEEGVWGRNLLKVSPLLAQPNQIVILSPVHAAEPVPQKEHRQEVARKAAAARWGKTK